MSRNLVLALLTAAGLAAAVPAAAQDPARATSIAVNVGESVGFGIWRDVSPRMAVGLELGGAFDTLEGDDLEQEVTDFIVEPALKLFRGSDGPMRPYLYLSAFYRAAAETSTDSNGDESEFEQTEIGGSLGFGMDWFPVSRVSVGGHVGVRGGMRDSVLRFPGTFGDEEIQADGPFARTFSSGIRVHFYF